MAEKLKITLVKSPIGAIPKQKANYIQVRRCHNGLIEFTVR